MAVIGSLTVAGSETECNESRRRRSKRGKQLMLNFLLWNNCEYCVRRYYVAYGTKELAEANTEQRWSRVIPEQLGWIDEQPLWPRPL